MQLTHDDLVVIRAALQFWLEEIGPHGSEAARGYLDAPITEAALQAENLRALRTKLQRCEVRHVRTAAIAPINDRPSIDRRISGTTECANITFLQRHGIPGALARNPRLDHRKSLR